MNEINPFARCAFASWKHQNPVTFLFFSPWSHSNDPPAPEFPDDHHQQQQDHPPHPHYPSHQRSRRQTGQEKTKQGFHYLVYSSLRVPNHIILHVRWAFASVTSWRVLLTDRRKLSRKHGFLISILLAFFLIMTTHISGASSSSSSSSHSSSSESLSPPQPDLTLGILVAESCNETFLGDLQHVLTTVIEDFNANVVEPELPPFNYYVNTSIFPQCSTAAVVSDLTSIFSETSIDAILALATYDVHSSFLPLAQLYGKDYFVLNSNLPGYWQSRHFSPFPTFSHQGLMLTKILDRYRWQDVFVAYTDIHFWIDFSTSIYVELTSNDFNVVQSSPLTSPVTSIAADEMLQAALGSKVIVLLMDVDDQLTLLASASSYSMTENHAFFSFSNNPYDVRWKSLLSLQSQVTLARRFNSDVTAIDVNIFESVFVISPTLPKPATTLTRRKRNAREGLNTHVLRGSLKSLSFTPEIRPEVALSGETLESQHKAGFLFNHESFKKESHTKRNLGLNQPQTYSADASQSSSGSTLYFLDKIGITSQETTKSSRNFQGAYGFGINPEDITNRLERVPQRKTFPISEGSPRKGITYFTSVQSSGASKGFEVSEPHNISSTMFFQKEPYSKRSLTDILARRLGRDVPSFVTESAASNRFKRDLQTYQATAADLRAVYDIVYLLSSLGYRYAENQDDTSSLPDSLAPMIKNISFQGSETKFSVDSSQTVQFDFTVYDFNVTSGQMEAKLFYRAVSGTELVLSTTQSISWPGGRLLPPDSCFKDSPDCDEGFATSYIVAVVVAAGGIVVIIFLLVILFRRYWSKKEMTKGPHKVILHTVDLFFISKKDAGKGSRQVMKSRATLTDKDNTPDIIRASDPTNRSMPSLNDLSDVTETARYNGDLVHVKELDIKNFEMKSKLLTFIRMLRDLRHENLNPYVGFLVDSVKPSLVMEFCSRGSLYDIIHNSDFKLDWDFKASLVTDLVRGIRYLHSSPLKCHAHLTSRNCVIDSRFVLKITDYGVNGIMECCKATKEVEPKDLLWTAPELLRNPALGIKGSEKGDIYAMSIIFQEVALRSEPYSTTGLTPDEIIKKLKKPPPLIRPSVTPQAAPPQFIQIMKQCWSEMPEMRPSVDEVYDQFKKLSGGKKANIVDTMFKMLEKYSNDLEEIVADRTMQLEEEKKKTDQLLFRMLPPTVAESLKRGQTVEAETFSEVSIYFSDIVGFTTISAMSTPMQVVDLLNDLYTTFDATIDNHDVYKVETIGDAYMVVSGLPIRNGNRHAGEISTMALMLLSQCGKFTIRHMPHVPLRLRIGLHTGSCVAGVVGLTMPRFCLFGDTVNTASRMESTGAAFRVHISESCKNVLDELGGYHVTYRGKTELKGKGKVNTFWLVGKEGFDKDLPEPPPLVGDDTHGLESLLRTMDLDPFAEPKPPIVHSSPTKSSSAPNLISPSASPQPSDTIKPADVSDTNTLSSSQPSNLDNFTTLHQASCVQSESKRPTSVVTADVIATGDALGNAPFEGHTRLETGDTAYQSHHSESNDSGFGSERKHSHGQEYNNALTSGGGGGVNCGGGGATPGDSSSGAEKFKRTAGTSSQNSSSNNRTSVVSSSDVSFSNHLTSPNDSHEEILAPVSEV